MAIASGKACSCSAYCGSSRPLESETGHGHDGHKIQAQTRRLRRAIKGHKQSLVIKYNYGVIRLRIELLIRAFAGLCLIALPYGVASPAAASKATERVKVYAPGELRVEARMDPIDVGRTNPRLSWHSHVEAQSAYEIEVASSPALLEMGTADLWDTGRVADGRSVAIPYTGKALGSRDKAFWRVRVWQNGSLKPGQWSDVAQWEMALLEPKDWQGKWITAPLFPSVATDPALDHWLEATAADPQFKDRALVEDTITKLRNVRPATYFRKTFTIDRPVRSARLYSTSAGYSEFYLSGQKIGSRILNPAQTDFDKRIYYDVDDLTDRLTVGEHVLAFHLGNGFYGERTAFGLDKLFYGEPAAIAQLEIQYEDGTWQQVVSDSSWLVHPSPIVKNGVYSGEVYDARLQIEGWSKSDLDKLSAWQSADVLETAPTQALIAAEMPPVRRVAEVKPQAILNPSKGIWTVDFGQNFTGIPTIHVARLGLEKGQGITLRFAEWADDAGVVGMNSGGSAPRTKQVDTYISDGRDMQAWSPSFTWHGFRYMEISGLDTAPPLDAITAHLTRTDLARIGQFSSSDPLLNRIHEIAVRSFETNLVSVPSDCPIRERNGWTGDAHATVSMASYNFAMGPFLEKYLGDFRTAEVIAPAIVPGRRTHSGKIDWAAAEVLLTWEHYLHTGDRTVIERQYDSLLEYVAYVDEALDNNLLTDPFHFYGDWCDTLPELGMVRPQGRCMSYSTPGDVTATALVARVYAQMADMAERIDRTDDMRRFTERRDAIRTAFHAAYYKGEDIGYGSQAANAMALQFGIAPANIAPSIAQAIDRDVREQWSGRASVGALGETWLYPALSDHGFADTALGVFTAQGPGTYRYLFDTLNGTTLWEDITGWVPAEGAQPGRSLNHPFKGGYDAWFFSGLGGIVPDAAQPGYKHFFLRPVFPSELDFVTVSLETGYGMVRSVWTREDAVIVWTAEVPMNTTATVMVNDQPFQIGPGEHRFTIDPNMRFIRTDPK